MTDDLDDLKSALQAATPAPNSARKAENLALAEKNFANLQGSANAERPTSTSPVSGIWRGVRTMLNTLTTRGGLVATTALIAVSFVALGPGSDLLRPPSPPGTLISSDEADRQIAKRAPETIGGEIPEAELADAAMPDVVQGVASQAMPGAENSPAGVLRQRPALRSAVPAPDYPIDVQAFDSETFANAPANPVRVTAEEPVSTFSIDVDTASYAIVRDSIMNGYLPAPEAVRVEEMINYFTYDYPAASDEMPFRASLGVAPTPWNPGKQLVHIGIQGALPAIEDRPPLNLVFLIDTSGSMQNPAKLPLLKQSFALMLGKLRPEDQVAIVTYAGSAGQVLEATSATERDTILAALNRLEAGGSTAGQEGLQQAYAVAKSMAQDDEVSRVILATDGDFNVGLSDPEALKTYISDQRESGTYLSVLGFGRGNLDDATMQALAQNGNGQAAFIDTLSEAQKVLVDQLSGALFAIADDVKIQVEFNPAKVAEYRLIGYETRALRREDFNNDAVDAGEIGAGTSVTALYEITPVGSAARLTDPLRYGASAPVTGSDEIGFLRLRYKEPGAETSHLIEAPITADLPPLEGTDWAAAIAGFGQLLRGGTYLNDWGWDEAIDLANANRGVDPFGYRVEAVQLMRLAQSLSAQ